MVFSIIVIYVQPLSSFFDLIVNVLNFGQSCLFPALSSDEAHRQNLVYPTQWSTGTISPLYHMHIQSMEGSGPTPELLELQPQMVSNKWCPGSFFSLP